MLISVFSFLFFLCQYHHQMAFLCNNSSSNHKNISRSSRRRGREAFPFLNPVQLIIIPLLLLLNAGTGDGDSDWEGVEGCGVCHCNWNSGKKTADCKNKFLQNVPKDLSTELQVVDLSNNLIAELQREQFQDANLQNLHKIFMRNSTLQELNRDALKGLVILIELDLSHNFIRILHSGTFYGLVKLRNLILNNNEVEILNDHLFADLDFLSRVEFKHNRLKHIALNAFGHLPMLSAVYFESNQLHMLRKETFARTPKLLHLSLAQNPWNCTCDLQQFRDFAISHRLYTPPTDCHDPKHLRGKLWTEIPSENFACRPRIIKSSVRSSENIIEAASENVTLTCRIRGSPQPNVLWIYNKRSLNLNDHRFIVRDSLEQDHKIETNTKILISELMIYGVRPTDKGVYTCIAENHGGKDEFDIELLVNAERFGSGDLEFGGNGGDAGMNSNRSIDSSSNFLLIIWLITITILLLMITVVLIVYWYCRHIKFYYHKEHIICENGLITSKIDKSHNNSSLLEGSVILEMQKSLLTTEVNPVEKPPRRTEIENVVDGDDDDGHEIKRTLLDETAFVRHPDDETYSVALSDSTHRPQPVYIDAGYATSLPPDLLSFPARVPASPSMQSSASNIPDNKIMYGGKSPISSPVCQQQSISSQGIFETTTMAPNGFMTLQHPKLQRNNLALVASAASTSSRSNHSPFLSAPVIMKQGYMTIPRKPRIPSWTSAQTASQLSEFQTTASTASTASPTASANESTNIVNSELVMKPVYDNLGLRTTAGGNSVLNLNKLASTYKMRDRPLPATPNSKKNDSVSTTISNTMRQQQQTLQQYVYSQYNQQQNNESAGDSQQHHLQHVQPNSQFIYNQQTQQQQQQQHLLNAIKANSHTVQFYDPLTSEIINNLMTTAAEKEPIAGFRHQNNLLIVPSNYNNNHNTTKPVEKIWKIPPRPPPKPKKKISVTSNSLNQLFDDEGEDGTEV